MTEIRELRGEVDFRAAAELSRVAFGGDPDAPFDPSRFERPGLLLGAFEGAELVAKLVVLPYEQWLGGRLVQMGGIAGVAVAAHRRGRGLAQQLLEQAISSMRAAGQCVSALFPTAVGLYRSRGWELVGEIPRLTLSTAELVALRPRAGHAVERMGAEHLEAVTALYAAEGARTNGLLSRAGPSFRGPEGVLDLDGAYVVTRAGAVVGYVTYDRGRGYRGDTQLTVHDCIGADSDALAALLAHLGSWGSVVGRVQLRVRPYEELALLSPRALPAPEATDRWMLRVTDAPAAIAARGWPAGVSLAVELDVHDAWVPEHTGPWRLVVDGGEARLEPGGSGLVRVDVRALAALCSSSYSASTLVRAGLLAGPPAALSALDLAFAGPPARMLDYF